MSEAKAEKLQLSQHTSLERPRAAPEDSPVFVSLTSPTPPCALEMGYLRIHNATRDREAGACKEPKRQERREESRCEELVIRFC